MATIKTFYLATLLTMSLLMLTAPTAFAQSASSDTDQNLLNSFGEEESSDGFTGSDQDLSDSLAETNSTFIVAPDQDDLGGDDAFSQEISSGSNIADPAFDEPTLPPLAMALHQGTFIDLERGARNVFIANPDIADIQLVNGHRLHLFAKNHGTTTFSVLDENNNIVYKRNIHVEFPTTQINSIVRSLYPESKVKMHSLNGNLIVAGTVKDANTAYKIMALSERVTGSPDTVENHLRIKGTNQVNLRVQIAEVNRDIRKELGIDLDAATTFGDIAVGLVSGVGALTGSSRVAASTAFGDTTLSTVLDAFDNKGLVSLLAEPNLTAVSGEAANFLVGGEIPIPFANDEGSISITFRPFGISLSFLPIVLENNSMRIKILTESSQIANAGAVQLNGFQVPSLAVRRAETTVNLGSGQSFAIAGLFQNNVNQSIEEFPGLAEVPILGALFRSSTFQKQESELIIIVTPYLVRPVSTQLALPTDGITPSSEAERNLFGQLTKKRVEANQTGLADAQGTVGPVGPVGFILR